MCRTEGPGRAPGRDRELVERSCPGERAEDGDDARARGEPEALATLRARRSLVRLRDRTPDDPHLLPVVPGDLVREEQPPRERRREPVGEPEVRVGLGQRRGDPAKAGCEHHRPGDEAAAAEHDVRAATGEDAEAVRRSGRGAPRGAELGRARPARKSGDGERVELEARLRHQPRLDAVGSAGERHRHSAFAERLPHGERRTNVTGGSPGRDHARELRRRAHSPRC